MRIAFDAKRMLNNPTGLGNHARILVNAMMRDYQDNEYLFFAPSAKDEFFNQLHGDFKVRFPETKMAQIIHPWWRSFGITQDILRNRVELFHGISNELPLNIHRSGIATVVTIHDLIFLKDKEQYPWLDRQFYIIKSKYAARQADAVIAVSEETKRDLMEIYGVPERKISVIYPSVDRRFYDKVSDEERIRVARQHKLPPKFILNVSSFFPRKNQIKLIEAFDRIKDKIDEDLVLIGSAGYILPDIQRVIDERKLGRRVHILTDVNNDVLPAIYQSASLFVFPSLFEGFGAPVLEALFSGVPVIVSQGGAIEEAAGHGALLIYPYEEEDIAEKMIEALKDGKIREDMIAKGLDHALTMTDRVFATKTMAVYESIL